MSTGPKAIFQSDKCRVYLWENVTPQEPGAELSCDEFTPREFQVEGRFLKAYLDVTCGGEWTPCASASLPGITKLFIEGWKIRPRITGVEEGMSAKFYLVVRR